ncbi:MULTISPECIES: hypothetical protein [unclassified Microcoleus]|uniref:hypothetical protein n=2 Tax=unclassified Microcoleus TaxID=2642155 RepID=UPI001E05119E|nr:MULTISPECIES: hypothetical protein [unclassified Microcoleus]MCC3430249.1 hypothetical protein [Microcoleus sp. PH2017_04_SCI_O_A]MCC3511485.1 hypothetical protein [Microcoleus sp. PH2017_17_BER_D_A]MCC3412348.1 hypothetical protein [Microcoleus sp. PH2017_02_FOX_O_A]MCC3423560.1 hypothetical protein [Microcoleus sp. PH2017_01_SCD_O_A]MCC3434146.1 hypothetical protein [Microcoleus sp. PH2017_05_CCC_O_A]
MYREGRRKKEEGRRKREEVISHQSLISASVPEERTLSVSVISQSPTFLPTANCQLPTANCQLPTANCQLPTAFGVNCQLSTVNCQLNVEGRIFSRKFLITVRPHFQA